MCGQPLKLHALTMKHGSFIILAYILGTAVLCQAQLISPNDMAVGKWSLSIKRRDRSLFESMVFPTNPGLSNNAVEVNQDSDSILSRVQQNVILQRKGLRCELILKGDGTFTLLPPDLSKIPDTKLGEEDDDSVQDEHYPRQPLKGQWNVRPNSYCVTDRHYDELTLKSLPKVKVPANEIGMAESNLENLETWEQITVELNCNVCGRFGSNSIRHLLRLPRGKDAGRLTHGTMSIVKTTSEGGGDHTSEETRRVLCATFRARH